MSNITADEIVRKLGYIPIAILRDMIKDGKCPYNLDFKVINSMDGYGNYIIHILYNNRRKTIIVSSTEKNARELIDYRIVIKKLEHLCDESKIQIENGNFPS